MCSRCSSSSGASRHMISIASWSPRKSDPLTVSYACDSQLSSGFSAALMPPAAATECERTGWTLLMIATLAPSSAAARAARWPARPAPMMRTSWEGMTGNLISMPRRGADRPPDLLDRHHPAQEVLAIQGEDGSQPAQRRLREQVLELLVGADDPVRPVAPGGLLGRDRRAPRRDLGLGRLAPQHAQEAVLVVDDRHERPAVALEDAFVGLQQRRLAAE